MPHDDELPTMPKKTGVSDGTASFSTTRTVARRMHPPQRAKNFSAVDASTMTRLKKIKAIVKNYNDTQFKGGNQGQAEAINRVRS